MGGVAFEQVSLLADLVASGSWGPLFREGASYLMRTLLDNDGLHPTQPMRLTHFFPVIPPFAYEAKAAPSLEARKFALAVLHIEKGN